MTPDRAFDKQFASIFGLPKGLMPTVAEPDPLAADETSDGIMAMNTDIQVSESTYYTAIADAEAEIKGAHDDDRR